MKEVKIFYFSGTGNSMFVARELAAALGGEALNAAKLIESAGSIEEVDLGCADVVGIVFPIYAYVYPKMIEKLFVKGKFGKSPSQVFAVATYGSSTGLALKKLSRRLRAKAGINIDYCNKVLMPENYTAIFRPDSADTISDKMDKARVKCAQIALDIQANSNTTVRGGLLGGVKTYIVGNVFYGFLKLSHVFFRADKKCTGCKICGKVCPTKNIVFVDGRKKPKWKANCTQCMACLNWCPAKAIQYSPLTKKRGRYQNPEAKLIDMHIHNHK